MAWAERVKQTIVKDIQKEKGARPHGVVGHITAFTVISNTRSHVSILSRGVTQIGLHLEMISLAALWRKARRRPSWESGEGSIALFT